MRGKEARRPTENSVIRSESSIFDDKESFDAQTFGDLLTLRMQSQRLSIEDLSTKSGINGDDLKEILSGDASSDVISDRFEQISEALNMDEKLKERLKQSFSSILG